MGTYSAESVPEEVLQDLINDNWSEYEESPLPNVIITNDPENAISMINMNESDHIVIYGEGEQIKYRGNITYFDRIYTMGISVYTKESRQRLRDLYRTMRAIFFTKKHNFTGWQLIRLISYQEAVLDNINIWRGEIRIQLENAAVSAETAV